MYTWGQQGLEMAPDYASDMERDNARFQQEMMRLRASNQYEMSTLEERARMEAQLLALKEGYLPQDMASQLLGVPSAPAGGGGNDSMLPEILGGAAGFGAGLKFSPQIGAGLSKAGSALGGLNPVGSYADDVLKAASGATRTGVSSLLNQTMPNVKSSGIQSLLQGAGRGASAATNGMEALGSKLAGKGSLKGIAKLLGGAAKLGGKAGGPLGMVAGIAAGELIENLLAGDDEEEAKRRYLSQLY